MKQLFCKRVMMQLFAKLSFSFSLQSGSTVYFTIYEKAGRPRRLILFNHQHGDQSSASLFSKWGINLRHQSLQKWKRNKFPSLLTWVNSGTNCVNIKLENNYPIFSREKQSSVSSSELFWLCPSETELSAFCGDGKWNFRFKSRVFCHRWMTHCYHNPQKQLLVMETGL